MIRFLSCTTYRPRTSRSAAAREITVLGQSISIERYPKGVLPDTLYDVIRTTSQLPFRIDSEAIISSIHRISIQTIGEVYYDREEDNNDEPKYLLPLFEEFEESTAHDPPILLRGLVLATAEIKK